MQHQVNAALPPPAAHHQAAKQTNHQTERKQQLNDDSCSGLISELDGGWIELENVEKVSMEMEKMSIDPQADDRETSGADADSESCRMM